MKLWLISQDVNSDYDTFDSAIVACDTEAEAQRIHPNGYDWSEDREDWISAGGNSALGDWARHPSQVKVKLIGEADQSISRGAVLASFNAG